MNAYVQSIGNKSRATHTHLACTNARTGADTRTHTMNVGDASVAASASTTLFADIRVERRGSQPQPHSALISWHTDCGDRERDKERGTGRRHRGEREG